MPDLAGPWTLADAERQFTAPITLPGDVHSALFAAGQIPDPYHGRNEYAVRWVADRDWTLSRSFELPDAAGPWTLVLDMLDTVAEVRLNGQPVLQAATSFREHRAEVAAALVAGENTIEITLRSGPRAANALQARQPFPIPYSVSNCPIPNGNMLRKPQCDFGWDWNIALAPVGVYGRIELIGPEGEIGDAADPPAPRGRHRLSRRRLRGDRRRRGREPVDRGARRRRRPAAASNPAPAGVAATLSLDRPALWWPAGSGEQPLHDLTLTAGGLTRTCPRRAARHPPRSPSPTRPAAASSSGSTAATSSPAAPTGSPPTPCPAASPTPPPATCCNPPPTPT